MSTKTRIDQNIAASYKILHFSRSLLPGEFMAPRVVFLGQAHPLVAIVDTSQCGVTTPREMAPITTNSVKKLKVMVTNV